tara:strand:+ start:312 stop:845 length:534 start_codon:yes stop_codon:yes gene_type:complete
MEIKKTNFKNLIEIKFKKYSDKRGSFIKIFNKKNSNNFKNECYESYLSISKKGAVRGLHAQSGRYAQDKLICCVKGKLLDLAIDIRKNSKTYGKVYKKILDSKNTVALFIPKGFIHGIISLKNETIAITYCSKKFDPSKEYGIKLDSIPLNMPEIKLILSKKDKKLPTYNEFMKKIK